MSWKVIPNWSRPPFVISSGSSRYYAEDGGGNRVYTNASYNTVRNTVTGSLTGLVFDKVKSNLEGYLNGIQTLSINFTGSTTTISGSGTIITSTVKSGYVTFTGTSGSFAHSLSSTPSKVLITASGSPAANYLGAFSWYASGSTGIWVVQTGSGQIAFNYRAEV